ncbi:GGDEF domain-containing protein [Oceanobacillus bengalensis]|uniref:GGDEF domain-containing protein n=1 Tax=Oceanobacillus bengalensis TaxID=1435466 RepID=A0A494YX75_9BACI|nr:GGDEF domain-containing protein [Oceanobacillus bengalensis]RKQ14625.1 GGDEF domain-containing protein [Oceanobacillus bengalensis]
MEKLTVNLQTIYFNLFSEFLSDSLKREDLLAKLVDQIHIILDISYVALYRLNLENQNYHLLAEASVLPSQSTEKTIPYNAIHRTEEILSNYLSPGLNSLYFGETLLIISNNDDFNNEIHIIIEETDKLLTLIDKVDKLKNSEHNHRTLYHLSTRLFSENEKEKVFIQIVDALEMLYPNASYYLLLAQDNEMINTTLPIKSFEINDDITKSMSTKAFMTGEFQMEDCLEENNTYLYAPLSGKQGIYGVLQMIIPLNNSNSLQQIEFIKQFSRLAGIAIERASLYENSKHQVSSLSLINEFSRQLNAKLELPEITKLLKKEIMDICQPTEIGFVYFDEYKLAELEIQSESTAYFKTLEGKKFVQQLFEKTLIESESIFSGKFDKSIQSSYQSIMAIPMNYSGYRHGLTVILHKDMYYFTFELFKLMEAFIQHATLAMMNAHLKAKLHKTVITDYLTGLYSRNYFEEVINKDMEQGEKGVLLLFDIDNFKKVNDKYGHHTGDQVIKQVANVMRSFSREKDIPARWGGEELAIYLPAISIQDGMKIAEFVRKQVGEVTDPHVTVSCGVSSWDKKENDSIVNLFLRSDKALYKAKQSGKNQIIKN